MMGHPKPDEATDFFKRFSKVLYIVLLCIDKATFARPHARERCPSLQARQETAPAEQENLLTGLLSRGGLLTGLLSRGGLLPRLQGRAALPGMWPRKCALRCLCRVVSRHVGITLPAASLPVQTNPAPNRLLICFPSAPDRGSCRVLAPAWGLPAFRP
jgi:hypothetical protein